MPENSKLRPLKAAKLKVAILEAAIDLIGNDRFKNLHISELCAKTKISKVTLFKYFPQKEDILLYYMRIWSFDRAVELRANPKKGIEGVFYIVDKLAESFERHPGLVLGFVGHLANTHTIQRPFPVKEEERKLLYPKVKDISSIEIKSLEQLLENFLLEAIFTKEITKSSNPRDLASSVTSVIYGTLVTAHIHRVNSSKLYFRRNIEMLLVGLR